MSLPEEYPTHDLIAERAYFRWRESGSHPGQDWEHWFEAEQDLAEQRCVHCLRAEGTSLDYGVSVSGYVLPIIFQLDDSDSISCSPDERDLSAYHLTAPSCLECSQLFELTEKEALIPLMFSLERNNLKNSLLILRILNWIDLAHAKDEEDRQYRLELWNHVKRTIITLAPSELSVPSPENRPREAILIRRGALEAIGRKITRVVFWSLYHTYIDDDDEDGDSIIEVSIAEDDEKERITEIIQRGHRIELPLDIVIAIHQADDGPLMLLIGIWGKIQLCTSVISKTAQRINQ